MGRRPVENKKKPSEYPQLAFRLNKEDKERLTELIEKVQSSLNNRRHEGAAWVNKNDIIVRALYEGLKRIK
jgi:hypothetical protein